MLQAVSDNRSLCFLSSLASRAVAAKLVAKQIPEGTGGKFYKGIRTLHPNTEHIVVVLIPAWDSLFSCLLNGVTEVLVSRIHIK